MRKQEMESGRSVLEMVAVLAIILLLTMGGLTGYSYLIQRYRRQESVKEVAELVMGVKTAELTRKHNAGATIAAREIVQGPQMDDKGQVIKLPEGENSFAVVTNLTGGAFALNLQLEPGTCPAILETLKDEDITMFLPNDKTLTDRTIAQDAKAWAEGSRVKEIMGVRYNVEETEEDRKLFDSRKGAQLRAEIMEACANENGLGRAAWIFDCSKGSSSYGYLYDLFCSGCPIGTMRDANGACCSYTSADRCGNLCSCPKGTMCNTEKQTCVECTTIHGDGVGNAACKNKYNLFSKHACNGETDKCVECVKHIDCGNTRGYKDSADYNTHYLYCYDNRCVDCNMDYDGTRASDGHYPCPSPLHPLCEEGVCVACDSPNVWNVAKGECVTCYDSEAGSKADKGCETDPKKPICWDPENKNDGSNKSGDTCIECLKDEHCTDPAKPVCNEDEHVCEQRVCPSEKPILYNNDCVKCYDSAAGYATDVGCEDDPNGPICWGPNANNKSGAVGTKCVGCAADSDCTDPSKPVCNTNTNECEPCPTNKPIWHNNKCMKCYDSAAGKNPDEGCKADANKPICWDPENTNNRSGAEGSSCVECATGEQCEEGEECRNNQCVPKESEECLDPKKPYWNQKLAACKNGGKADECCAYCYDSDVKAKEDAGCGKNGKNICLTPGNKNDGTGTNGTDCKACQDTATGSNQDLGCGEGTWKGKNICVVADKKNSASKEWGNSCVECLVNADCPSSKPFCEKTDGAYKCVTCKQASELRKHNPLRTVYVKNDTQDGCYVCQDNKAGNGVDNGCGKAPSTVCVNNVESPASKYINGGTGLGLNGGCIACPSIDECIDTKGVSGTKNACIKVKSFDDIVRGKTGECECLGTVSTQSISDQENSSTVKDWDKKCSRLQSSRKRVYEIPVKFYCPRYMWVNGTADDFVSSSTPEGIGTSSPAVKDTTWRSAHNNTIKPLYSSATIGGTNKQETARMVVRDRWLREVGYKGAFYFSKKKPNTEEKRAASKSEAKKKLTVKARWAKDHTKNKPLGKWVDKVGESGCGGNSGGGGTSRCKQGSHIGHDWIKARYKNCSDCGTNTHEKADSDNKNEPHTHWYCYCDC